MKKNFIFLSAVFAFFLFSCSNKETDLKELQNPQANPSSNKYLTNNVLSVGDFDHNFGLEAGKPAGEWSHFTFSITTPVNYESVTCKIFRTNPNTNILEYARYRIVRLDPTLFNNVVTKADGEYSLPTNSDPAASTGGALDFMRHPGVLKALCGKPWKNTQDIIAGNSIPKFDSLLTGSTKIFVFGSHASSSPGLHYVTQNQAEIGTYQGNNGIWQDGGVIVQKNEIVSFRKVWSPALRRYIYLPVYGNTYYLLMLQLPLQMDFSTETGGYSSFSEMYQQNISLTAGQSMVYGPYSGTQLTFELLNCTGDPNLYVTKGYPNSNSVTLASENYPGNEFARVYGAGQYYFWIKANGVASKCDFKIRIGN
jgi:hypothetical protein